MFIPFKIYLNNGLLLKLFKSEIWYYKIVKMRIKSNTSKEVVMGREEYLIGKVVVFSFFLLLAVLVTVELVDPWPFGFLVPSECDVEVS